MRRFLEKENQIGSVVGTAFFNTDRQISYFFINMSIHADLYVANVILQRFNIQRHQYYLQIINTY